MDAKNEPPPPALPALRRMNAKSVRARDAWEMEKAALGIRTKESDEIREAIRVGTERKSEEVYKASEARFIQQCVERLASDIDYDIMHGTTYGSIVIADRCGKLHVPQVYNEDDWHWKCKQHTPCKTLHTIVANIGAVAGSWNKTGGVSVKIAPPAPCDIGEGGRKKDERDLRKESVYGECRNREFHWSVAAPR